jgi:hypothetical protein
MRSTVEAGFNTTNNVSLYLDATNRFSNPGGSIWYDISGRGNHFNLNGAPTYIDGGPLQFNYNGGNQYAACNNASFGNFGSSSFTLEFVYNYVTGSGAYPAVFKKRSSMSFVSGSGNPGIAWNMDVPGAVFVVDEFGLFNNGSAYMAPGTIKNQIIHSVMTVVRPAYDRNIITGSIYINSVLQSDNIQCRMTGSGIINSANTATLIAGDSYATASLYLVRAYDSALSQTEINSLYISARVKYGF